LGVVVENIPGFGGKKQVKAMKPPVWQEGTVSFVRQLGLPVHKNFVCGIPGICGASLVSMHLPQNQFSLILDNNP
jgi:hypothetical protein